MHDPAVVRVEKQLSAQVRWMRRTLDEIEPLGNDALTDRATELYFALVELDRALTASGRRYRRSSTAVRICETL